MADVGALRLPTIVLSGANDQLTPPKFSRFLAERIPTSTLVVFDEAGHELPVEVPAEVAEALAGRFA